MTIGERIKKHRKAIGMSAKTLAERIGKSAATIYRYENGDIRNLDSRILLPIADALGVTPGILMGWEEDDDERAGIVPATPAPPAEPPEAELVDLYRGLNAKGQDMLVTTARSFAANPDLKKGGEGGRKAI